MNFCGLVLLSLHPSLTIATTATTLCDSPHSSGHPTIPPVPHLARRWMVRDNGAAEVVADC